MLAIMVGIPRGNPGAKKTSTSKTIKITIRTKITKNIILITINIIIFIEVVIVVENK